MYPRFNGGNTFHVIRTPQNASYKASPCLVNDMYPSNDNHDSLSFVVYQQVVERCPVVGVNITKQVVSTIISFYWVSWGDLHVCHTTPQAVHDRLWMPSEHVHDSRPAESGECRPCIILYPCAGFGCNKGGERVHVRLHGKTCHGEYDSREDVYHDLLRIRIMPSLFEMR